ncbi:tetratricopeptide repeat protein [Acidobacteria bacterium AH-259-G07]|nr:tetratricopeptide repeat protein [Acidobacteria bacterium AH-259-G07]
MSGESPTISRSPKKSNAEETGGEDVVLKAADQPRVVMDSLPPISHTLKLVCRDCGKAGVYDVGHIFVDSDKDAHGTWQTQFSNYFRCRSCGWPGPWDIADYLKLIALTLKSRVVSDVGLYWGALQLFDGTRLQTPAMAEEYLKDLIRKDPDSAFLHTRLGNLFRRCGQNEAASEHYQEAVQLDPNDIEAHHHLNQFAGRKSRYQDALQHSGVIIHSIMTGGARAESDALTKFVLNSTLSRLREQRRQFIAAINGNGEVHPGSPAFKLIERVLNEEGDDQEIVEGLYATCLGEVEPREDARELAPDLSPELCSQILEGALIRAEEVNPQMSVRSFVDAGVQYRVLDQYCLNPDCDCEPYVALSFSPVPAKVQRKSGGLKLEPVLYLHYECRTDRVLVKESSMTRKARRRLWRKFKAQCGDIVGAYSQRRKELRDLARQSLLSHDMWSPDEIDTGHSRQGKPASNRADELICSLNELIKRENLDPDQLSVAFRMAEGGKPQIPSRNIIDFYDGEKVAQWRVDSLQELFRGNQEPPPDREMEQYPPEYVDFFYLIERHLITICERIKPPPDEEFIRIFSAVRKRPDGRSLGLVHDAVWQCACLALGLRPYSEAEFKAVLGQLARSARHWKEGFASRNYISYLRSTLC